MEPDRLVEETGSLLDSDLAMDRSICSMADGLDVRREQRLYQLSLALEGIY